MGPIAPFARLVALAGCVIPAAIQAPAEEPVTAVLAGRPGFHEPSELAAADLASLGRMHSPVESALTFVENRGQWDARARFLVRQGSMAGWLEDRGLTLGLHRAGAGEPFEAFAVRLAFEGASECARPMGEGPLPGKMNFFLGNDPSRWATGVASYASVVYRELYPGIDLRLRTDQGVLEYDILVAPGADLAQVEVRCEGIDALEVAPDGGLSLATPFGPIRQSAPKTWCQLESGERLAVDCRPVKLSERSFGFRAEARHPRLALVIDPGLEWSTYLGGTSNDTILGLAATGSGPIVAVGRTISPNFPVNVGPSTLAGTFDAFAARLDPDQSGSAQRVWATFFGGSSIDQFLSVGLDASENVYAVGETLSIDLPTTPGAFDTSPNGQYDACVVMLDPTGSTLVYSTLFGGSSQDGGAEIVVIAAQRVAIAGTTSSAAPSFPVTPGALQATLGGGYDYYFARLDLNGTGSGDLAYSTFFGGNMQEGFGPGTNGSLFDEKILGLARHGANFALTGTTFSTNLATTPNAYQPSNQGLNDGFLAVVRPAGQGLGDLIYGSYLGGSNYDGAGALAVDASGTITVGGYTYSFDFPTTPGAFNTSFHGPSTFNDAFLARLDPSQAPATQLVYSTLLTDNGFGSVSDLVLLEDGRVAGTGFTGVAQMQTSMFPVTCGAFDTTFQLHQDGIVFLLDPKGQGVSDLHYASFVGGTSIELGLECALASSAPTPRLIVGGYTESLDFPTTPAAFKPTTQGPNDGFALRIELAPAVIRYCSSSPNSVGTGALIAANGTLSVLANNFSLVASGAPPNKLGLFIYAQGQNQVPFGNGVLCLAQPIFRLSPGVMTNASGVAERPVDLNSTAILPGSSWNFQFWYRDPAGGGASFNLSDAFRGIFCL
jgi:hypothetical protein